jgi:hypothetical protein
MNGLLLVTGAMTLAHLVIFKQQNMKRAEGYYWVCSEELWYIAKWSEWESSDSDKDSGCWELPGTEIWWYDRDLDEIDENRIVRNKTLNNE